jgi:hypothetical protein
MQKQSKIFSKHSVSHLFFLILYSKISKKKDTTRE